MKRRDFLRSTSCAAATLAGARLYAAEASPKPGPSGIVNLGVIGCGHRGAQLANILLKVAGCRFTALCDVDQRRLDAFRELVGGEKVAVYRDFRKLLESRDVDAVIVVTGENWHCLLTVHACRAGKDVYVEKPMCHTIGEGRVMVEAAKKYDRIVQHGAQQRSSRHYAEAVEIIHSGRLGDISEVKVWDYENRGPGIRKMPADSPAPPELDWDTWLGPAPYVPFNQARYGGKDAFWETGGGFATGWGVHHFDIVNWAMGVGDPLEAVALGGNFAADRVTTCPETLSGVVGYGPAVSSPRGFVLQYSARRGCRGRQDAHGKCFYGTKGTLHLDRSGYVFTEELPDNRGPGERKEVKAEALGDPYSSYERRHLEVFLENVRNHTQPFADAEVGHYAVLPAHLMNIAYRVKRAIRWDAEKQEIPGDAEANALVTRVYRAPWKLEV